MSWRPLPYGPVVQVGTWRSPLRTPAEAALFAEAVLRRPGFTLVGVLGYEGQIAGLGDAPPGRPLRARVVRMMQARSAAELRERRAEAVRRIRALTPLEFVNGGGTGSLESTAADKSVTELAAGSGLVGPTLFDAYRGFHPGPPCSTRCRWYGGRRRGGHPVQRRLHRLGHRDAGPAAHAVPACGAEADQGRGRGRGADPGARRRRRTGCESATGSGSGTPRAASLPSGSPTTT